MKYYLKCKDGTHPPIHLPDKQSVTVGRSAETRIKDPKCSRKQLEIKANYENGRVLVKQLGATPTKINGTEIGTGNEVELRDSDTLHIIEQSYPHVLYKKEKSAKLPKRKMTDFFTSANSESPSKKQHIEKEVNEESLDESEVLKKLQQFKSTTVKSENLLKENNQKSDSHWEPCGKSNEWENFDDMMIFWPQNLFHSDKIIAFDMDGTLITTASGKTFAIDCNDWKILYAEVPGKLKQLYKEKYKVVIFTNQMGIQTKKVKPDDLKRKVEALIKKLGVPIQVIAITKKGKHRKPNIGSWTWLQEQGNGGIVIDKPQSMYVGDAAGRPKDWAPKKKKDFSCSDRLFAINLGIEFKTPEEFFMKQKPAKFDMPEFDPRFLPDLSLTSDNKSITSDKQEVALLVGFPACGKSTVAKEYFVKNNYVHINRDTLKTWQKCVKTCKDHLAEGKSVVIDNTNPDKETRKRYISCAKEQKCPCRCFVMNVSMEHAMHNNRFRELSGDDHAHVPRMVFYQHRKAYQEPKIEEGFDDIIKINFVPKFKNAELEKMYKMFND